MKRNIFNKLAKAIEYYKNPRYVIIKGVTNDNRAIMSLCARPVYPPHIYQESITIYGYCCDSVLDSYVSYKNQKKLSWHKDKVYKKIWTFKELRKWRKMLPPTGFRCLEKINIKWKNITNEKDV